MKLFQDGHFCILFPDGYKYPVEIPCGIETVELCTLVLKPGKIEEDNIQSRKLRHRSTAPLHLLKVLVSSQTEKEHHKRYSLLRFTAKNRLEGGILLH